MATKSVFKSVTIRNKRQCEALVKALEKAKAAKVDVVFNKAKTDLTNDQIKALFGDQA